MDAYEKGLNGKQAAWASEKYMVITLLLFNVWNDVQINLNVVSYNLDVTEMSHHVMLLCLSMAYLTMGRVHQENGNFLNPS
jgi:hypothetical protein